MQACGVFFIFFAMVCSVQNPSFASERPDKNHVSGTLTLPEISGAVMMGHRLLVVADDAKNTKDKVQKFHMIALLQNTRLENNLTTDILPDEYLYQQILSKWPGSNGKANALTDLEAVAISPQNDLFLITSHRVSKKGKTPEKRKHLLRVRLHESTGNVEQVLSYPNDLLDHLPESLVSSAHPLNIEGLAWAKEGDLLIGLRSPTLKNNAVILRLKNANGIFDHQTKPEITTEAQLNLEGLGIRGLCEDKDQNGYWIIAGRSSDPDETGPSLGNNWAIYFWDGKTDPQKKWQKKTLPENMQLDNPEAICLYSNTPDQKTQHLLVISDNGANQPSTYIFLPVETRP